MRIAALVTAVFCFSLAALACDGREVEESFEEDAIGELQLPLIAPAAGGGNVRLVDATLEIRNSAGSVVATMNGSTGQSSVKQRLSAGDYTIKLLDGWSAVLELDGQSYPAGPFEVVQNPKSFSVASGGISHVAFDFKNVGSVVATLNAPPRLASGVLRVDQATGDLASLLGASAGFNWEVRRATRTFPSATQTRLEFTDETFSWTAGAPPLLQELFADYQTGFPTRNILLQKGIPAITFDMTLEKAVGATNNQLRLSTYGAQVLDASGHPVPAPFCDEFTGFTITRFSPAPFVGTVATGTASGVVDFCWR